MEIGLQFARTNGWTLRIEQNGNRPMRLFRECADTRYNVADGAMACMAHVQPKDVGSSINQLPQHVGAFAGWAKCADDFGLPHRSGIWASVRKRKGVLEAKRRSLLRKIIRGTPCGAC